MVHCALIHLQLRGFAGYGKPYVLWILASTTTQRNKCIPLGELNGLVAIGYSIQTTYNLSLQKYTNIAAQLSLLVIEVKKIQLVKNQLSDISST